jgi:hypothetical protein
MRTIREIAWLHLDKRLNLQAVTAMPGKDLRVLLKPFGPPP